MGDQKKGQNREPGPEGWSVAGFRFETEEEYENAKREEQGIRYMKSRIDFQHPRKVLEIYTKLVEENVFTSPLGQYFLKDLQEYLLAQHSLDQNSIPPVPVSQDVVVEEVTFVKDEKQVRKKKTLSVTRELNYKRRYHAALAVNVILALAIIAMLAIAHTSGSVTILNYENKLIDRYASWEQELTQREQEVKAREAALAAPADGR